AAGDAEPATATATEFAWTACAAVVIRPADPERRDGAAGARRERRTEAPHFVELEAAAQLDLVAEVVEQDAVAFVDRWMVVVLHQVGVVVARIRIDRALDVALRFRPQIAGVESPLVVPGAVELELQCLVGALGLLVAHHQVAAEG